MKDIHTKPHLYRYNIFLTLVIIISSAFVADYLGNKEYWSINQCKFDERVSGSNAYFTECPDVNSIVGKIDYSKIPYDCYLPEERINYDIPFKIWECTTDENVLKQFFIRKILAYTFVGLILAYLGINLAIWIQQKNGNGKRKDKLRQSKHEAKD